MSVEQYLQETGSEQLVFVLGNTTTHFLPSSLLSAGITTNYV